MEVVNVKCDSCGDKPSIEFDVSILTRYEEVQEVHLCFQCIKKARRLASEYSVNGTVRLEDVEKHDGP